MKPSGVGGACSGRVHSTEGGAYHSHLLLEVIQVPALLGAFALLGRALVIFFVLRGGDTIAVRATRLRARRGYRGTPALRAHSHPGLCLWAEGWFKDLSV